MRSKTGGGGEDSNERADDKSPFSTRNSRRSLRNRPSAAAAGRPLARHSVRESRVAGLVEGSGRSLGSSPENSSSSSTDTGPCWSSQFLPEGNALTCSSESLSKMAAAAFAAGSLVPEQVSACGRVCSEGAPLPDSPSLSETDRRPLRRFLRKLPHRCHDAIARCSLPGVRRRAAIWPHPTPQAREP